TLRLLLLLSDLPLACLSFPDTAPIQIHTLSLHDALPISIFNDDCTRCCGAGGFPCPDSLCSNLSNHPRLYPGQFIQYCSCLFSRSEEHTSELQSRFDLVCRLLLEKKKTTPILAIVQEHIN